MAITIVGLGPGDGRYLTRQAWDLLAQAERVYLRTERHPTVADLPSHVARHSYDHVYESAQDFAEVYERITADILHMGRETGERRPGVIYAVPGHPLVGESTVTAILAAAAREAIPVDIVAGMSFVEPSLTAIGVDALTGLQLFDAMEVAGYNHPPLNTDAPVLLGQVFSQAIANELKLALMVLYPDEHEVVLIHAAGTESQSVERIPLYLIDRSNALSHLTSLYVPPLPYASTLGALAETVAYLRGPHGCPWDQEQTRASLRTGLLEEAAEVLEAIDADDPDALCEELGDLLYHLVMQTQIASELGEFNLTDVVGGIESKLKRRHPHVWGDWVVADSAEVVRNWEALKADEKTPATSLLDNIPTGLPALARSQKMQDRVGRIGFDWPNVNGVVAKIEEEIAELEAADTPESRQAELGDVLFVLVNWARWLGADAEVALREANRRFDQRFRHMEQLAATRGLALGSLDLAALNSLWEEAKDSLVRGLGDGEAADSHPLDDGPKEEA